MPDPDRLEGRETVQFKFPKCRSPSVSKVLGRVRVYFSQGEKKKKRKKKAVYRTKTTLLHYTVVYILPGMNNKKD